MDQTFVCCSTYHVYISILEAYKYKDQGGQSLLILFNDILDGTEEFAERIRDIGIFKAVITISGYTLMKRLKREVNLLTYTFSRPRAIIDLYETHNPVLLQYHDFMEHSDFNLFQINRTRSYFLIKYKKNFFRMYEDGYGTYQQKLPIIRAINRKHITKIPLLKGHDEQVKEVYVSTPEKITDKVLIPKLKKLDIEALEDFLSEDDREKIVAALISDVSLDQHGTLSLVITQPLSEDSICTEEVKIRLYQKLVDDEIAKGHYVYVKTHPREKTTYPFHNENVSILPGLFPLEVFNLSHLYKIESAVAFFSTALYNLKHTDDKILLGEDYLKKEIQRIS